MKWAALEPGQNSFDFSAADQHLAFAQAHGMAVHGHNLAWGAFNPAWLTNGSWTAASLTNVLYNHIDNVVGHYRGKIAVWDVVNEPINTPSIWQGIIGSSYIDLALRRAHVDDPAACLIINEYSDETLGGAGDAMYSLAQGLVQSGSPLCGIGMQFHVDGNGVDYNSFSANMARFAQLGLKIYITEMDVRISGSPSAADLSNQANVYQNVLDRCLLQPACGGLQTWGFTDKYSWVPGFFSGMGAALPFDANYQAKPAYYAVQTRLGGLRAPTSTPTPIGGVPTTATASFVGQDVTTSGTWKGVYGAQGYLLQGDGQSLPSYAAATFSNASTYMWAGSTNDPRALQKAASSTDRLAAAWDSSSQFVTDVNVTDGQPHKISLYGVDWDQGGRGQAIDVVDARSGVVLDHRSLSSFANGEYLSWTVSGHVQLRATRTAGPNAVVSGLFLDPAVTASATSVPTSAATPVPSTSTPTSTASSRSTASFVAQDMTTGGNWKGTYGGQGYWLEGDGQSLPSYATATVSNAGAYTWAASTNDRRALQKAASSTDRVAATWYSSSQFITDVNLTDGQLHKVSLYSEDWDQGSRSESVDVVDPSSGVVLDHRNLSGFVNGAYLSWTLSGHVQLRVTWTAGPNAVVSGIFFDPLGASSATAVATPPPTLAPSTPTPSSTSTGTSASFVAQDMTSGGNWKGTYGGQGYWLEGDGQSLPSTATATVSNAGTYTWAASTNDRRALQKAASSTDRVAATWYSSSQFVTDVNLIDGQLHKVSLYSVDWDQRSRVQSIDVVDASSGLVLDHRNLSGFVNGAYLSWMVSGHVQLRVTQTAGDNAVVSGFFLD
jgi:GH35 family endo-1,4-beta-xylanase